MRRLLLRVGGSALPCGRAAAGRRSRPPARPPARARRRPAVQQLVLGRQLAARAARRSAGTAPAARTGSASVVRDEAAEDHDRHRVHDLEARRAAHDDERQQRPARAPRRVVSDRREPLARAALRPARGRTSRPRARGPGSGGSAPRRCARRARTAPGSPSSEPSESSAPSISAAEHAARPARPAASGTPAPPAASCGTPPAAAGRSRSRRASAKPSIAVGADLLAGASAAAPRRGTRAGSSTSARRSSMSFGDGAEAAPADVGLDVEAARDGVALDDGRRLRDAHVGDLAEAHVAAARACRSAGCGRPPRCWRVSGAPCTITSKTFCSSNTLPTWMPCSSVGLRAAHVAGLDARSAAPCRGRPRSRASAASAGSSTRGSTTPSTSDIEPGAPCPPRGAGRPGPGRRRARRAACRSRSARRGRRP